MKQAYLFPGQGSQYPGMARPLYERSAQARELLERANSLLGFRITDIMFEGTADDLKATRVTQPAIFLHSTVLALCSGLSAPAMAAGHSLGEFSALCVAGALSFEDALRLVSARAHAMQACCEKVPGAMAAVLKLADETVEQLCEAAEGLVIAANYNCPGQVVISGEKDAVERACVLMKEAGAKRALPLPVGGAFHSPLMEPAREELARAIAATPFRTPVCPVYQNVDGLPSTDPGRIREKLLTQLTSPVRWTQTVRRMVSDGATSFLEIGPGTVLTGLSGRIVPDIPAENLNE